MNSRSLQKHQSRGKKQKNTFEFYEQDEVEVQRSQEQQPAAMVQTDHIQKMQQMTLSESAQHYVVQPQKEEEKKAIVKTGSRYHGVTVDFEEMRDPMCFIEIEMTDPDPRKAQIVEIAACLVSGDMKVKQFLGCYVIKFSADAIKDEFVIDRFKKSGLWQDMQDPRIAIELQEAEQMLVHMLEKCEIMSGSIPSAGIQANYDRIILQRLMPHFNTYLSYTIIDISSIDEVARRWNGQVFKKRDNVLENVANQAKKIQGAPQMYRAESNIIRAINRLQLYKQNLFNVKEKGQHHKSQQQQHHQNHKRGGHQQHRGGYQGQSQKYGYAAQDGYLTSIKYQKPM